MKKRSRLLAMLMALAMVLAYMPAMAFAEGEEPASDDGAQIVRHDKEAVEEAVKETIEAPAEVITEDAKSEDSSDEEGYWWIEDYYSSVGMWVDDGNSLDDIPYVDVYYEGYTSGSEPGLKYYWCKMNGSSEGTHLDEGTLSISHYDGYATSYTDFEPSEVGTYRCVIFNPENEEEKDYVDISVIPYTYYTTNIGGINYERWSETDAGDSKGAGVWGYNNGSLAGNVTISPYVTLRNGKTYPVNYVGLSSSSITSITIPPTVTNISGVGVTSVYDPVTDSYKDVAIPGFVIYGTNGSFAQTYAAQRGIVFSDPVNGTPDGSIAKVKISKPSAAKKSITVKWKKFTKKQLKKAGAIKYEIWVAKDAGFTNVVKTATAGKKKATKKIKGLSKGTYYVKVRAVKQVGVYKMAGAWSKTKKVKVKK